MEWKNLKKCSGVLNPGPLGGNRAQDAAEDVLGAAANLASVVPNRV